MIIKTDRKQKTIAKEVSLNGVGLHTGKNVTLTFKPAPENFGFAFKRIDLEGTPIIEADANYVTNTQRGTCLEKKGVKIQTSEHVLAALVGMEIDNVIIELNESVCWNSLTPGPTLKRILKQEDPTQPETIEKGHFLVPVDQ